MTWISQGTTWRGRGGATFPHGGGPPAAVNTLWGACGNSSSQPPTSLETQMGRPVGVRRHYWQPTSSSVNSSITTASGDVNAGRVPWLSYKLPGEWDACAAGTHDAWALDICARLGALPGRVMLTWHHEPEGESNGGALMHEWVAMHDRFAGFAAAYPNIRCGPILAGYQAVFGSTAAHKLNNIWPGAFNSGDFIAMDPYNLYGSYGAHGDYDGNNWTPPSGRTPSFNWTDIVTKYGEVIIPFAQAKGIEWGYGEFGMSNDAEIYEETNFGGVVMFDRLWDQAVDSGNCIALAYFDTAYNSTCDWRLINDKRTAWLDVAQTSPDGSGTTWPS